MRRGSCAATLASWPFMQVQLFGKQHNRHVGRPSCSGHQQPEPQEGFSQCSPSLGGLPTGGRAGAVPHLPRRSAGADLLD